MQIKQTINSLGLTKSFECRFIACIAALAAGGRELLDEVDKAGDAVPRDSLEFDGTFLIIVTGCP